MVKGIDVSTHQKTVNWTKVAASGIDFAMIKATQGRGEGVTTRYLRRFTDSQFKRNIEGASAAGLAVGVYHYMTAQTLAEAIEEADYFCDTIEPYRDKITLWAAADVESSMYLGKLSREALTAVTRRFMDIVAYRGYKPMLYTNPDHLVYRFTPDTFRDDDIWLASWTAKPLVDMPKMRIWQYGAGRVDGITPKCDLNYGYFELPERGYKVGDKYTIKAGDTYINGIAVPTRLVGREYTIMQVRDSDILLGEINSRVKI